MILRYTDEAGLAGRLFFAGRGLEDDLEGRTLRRDCRHDSCFDSKDNLF